MRILAYVIYKLENGEVILFENNKKHDSCMPIHCNLSYYDADEEEHALGW